MKINIFFEFKISEPAPSWTSYNFPTLKLRRAAICSITLSLSQDTNKRINQYLKDSEALFRSQDRSKDR